MCVMANLQINMLILFDAVCLTTGLLLVSMRSKFTVMVFDMYAIMVCQV